MNHEIGKELSMREVLMVDCLVYYFMDYLEVVIENGKITGFLYRENPLE